MRPKGKTSRNAELHPGKEINVSRSIFITATTAATGFARSCYLSATIIYARVEFTTPVITATYCIIILPSAASISGLHLTPSSGCHDFCPHIFWSPRQRVDNTFCAPPPAPALLVRAIGSEGMRASLAKTVCICAATFSHTVQATDAGALNDSLHLSKHDKATYSDDAQGQTLINAVDPIDPHGRHLSSCPDFGTGSTHNFNSVLPQHVACAATAASLSVAQRYAAPTVGGAMENR